ncbi:MAG: hypothetical protein GY754_21140 [bacterium]|nr:hypothetical protein [bacterium]
MSESQDTINVNAALSEIGDAVITTLNYECYPLDKMDHIITLVDTIVSDYHYVKRCEDYFKSAGSNYKLFFISSILFRLTQKGKLIITPDVLKWLGSVWKNFITRNKKYQELFPILHQSRLKFEKYYPGAVNFVNQIGNVHLVKEDYLDDPKAGEVELEKLELFHQNTLEIITWMRPSYFFLLDYYYEKTLSTGDDSDNAEKFEKNGLKNFGHTAYQYENLVFLECQALGILEAIYLSLRKKKRPKKLISVDGKKRLLSTNDIYNVYLDKFNQMKKELFALNQD